MKILVTGGSGYIGSHTCVELVQRGHTVIVADNLSNSDRTVIGRIKKITNKNIMFYEGDIRNSKFLNNIFAENSIDSVIHFAALKAVGESTEKPLDYYENNVAGTISLLKSMMKHNCRTIIFSSSATVYGNPEEIPITESCPTGACTNPYGRTKQMMEQILRDIYSANHDWNITLLRYFNPIGAHPSGIIGEQPNGVPNNLMPYVTQVAIGQREQLNVFGNDYPTPDGTGVRDYIHVVDLANAHVQAIERLEGQTGVHVYNVGTGKGYSVLELVHTFEKVNGINIPFEIKARRPGDIAKCYCDASKAKKELEWEARYNLEDMCRDAWNWQKNNPNGYEILEDE